MVPRKDVVKTIKTQKEVFECIAPGTTVPIAVLDVETFTEIFEKPAKTDAGEQTFRPVAKRVEVSFCVKELIGTPDDLQRPPRVACEFQTPDQVLLGGGP